MFCLAVLLSKEIWFKRTRQISEICLFWVYGNPQKARSTLQCNINVKANKCCFYFYMSCWTVLFDSVILASRTGQLLSCPVRLASKKWLGWIFHGGYLPSLIVNCVGMSKDMGRRLPQLYYIKMKIYDLSFIAIRVAMETKTRQQSKHSCWVLHSPWCRTALVIYPSKGIKCHCKIIPKPPEKRVFTVLLTKFAFIVTFEEFLVLYSERSFYKCLINLSCPSGRHYRRK